MIGKPWKGKNNAGEALIFVYILFCLNQVKFSHIDTVANYYTSLKTILETKIVLKHFLFSPATL